METDGDDDVNKKIDKDIMMIEARMTEAAAWMHLSSSFWTPFGSDVFGDLEGAGTPRSCRHSSAKCGKTSRGH